MSKKAVEQLLGRIMVDEAFRAKARKNLGDAMKGFDLTDDERQALQRIDLVKTSQAIDKIWNRASLAFGFSGN